MCKVSVIIPVYNAEKYLNNTVNSLLNQKFKDFEIILINDGSKDRSGSICDEFKNKDSRIKVIHQINNGVSYTRNIGLRNAKGEWISFVDCDDTVEEDFLFNFVHNSEKSIDLIISGYNVLSNQKIVSEFLPDMRIGGKEDFLKEFFQIKKDGIFNAIWNKFYKLDIIRRNNIMFDENLNIAEDVLFNLEYVAFIENYKIIKNASYNYITSNNESSLTKIYNQKFINFILTEYNATKQFLINNDYYFGENLLIVNQEYFGGIDWGIHLIIESKGINKVKEIKYLLEKVDGIKDLKIEHETKVFKVKKYLFERKKAYIIYLLYKLNQFQKSFIKKV